MIQLVFFQKLPDWRVWRFHLFWGNQILYSWFWSGFFVVSHQQMQPLKWKQSEIDDNIPDTQCMVYLPTFTHKNQPNVGKYAILIECLGMWSWYIKHSHFWLLKQSLCCHWKLRTDTLLRWIESGFLLMSDCLVLDFCKKSKGNHPQG